MKSLIAILMLGTVGAFAQETVVETRRETIQEEAEREVVKADTLWDLAEHFYHNPWLWPRIYEANTDRIKDPNRIYPGQVFVIPGLGRTVMVTDKEVKKPEPAPAPEPEPEPEPMVEPAPKAPPGELADSDSLSTEFPKGLTGQTTAMPRYKMPKGWTPDGRVLDYQGKESMTASGDLVRVQVSDAIPVRRRTRLAVYRWSAVREDDSDPKGIYVQRVGEIEIVRKIKDGEYRAMVVKSGGSIQLNDILKAE